MQSHLIPSDDDDDDDDMTVYYAPQQYNRIVLFANWQHCLPVSLSHTLCHNLTI